MQLGKIDLSTFGTAEVGVALRRRGVAQLARVRGLGP